MRFFTIATVFSVTTAAGLFGDSFQGEIDDFFDRMFEDEPVTTPTAAPTTTATTAAAATTAAGTTTTSRPIDVRRHQLVMNPRFIFGSAQFRRARRVREDQIALCPTEKDYCIDTRRSDAATCMHPPPLDIKRCLDRSCRNAPENDAIFAEYGEPSYCKDYMAMPEGRICHWGTTFCSCPEFDIEYVDAVVQLATDRVPTGFRQVAECNYPVDYKAENDYEGPAATLAPVPLIGGAGRPRAAGLKGSSAAGITVLTAVIVTALL